MKKILVSLITFVALCHTASANDNTLYIVANDGGTVKWEVASLQKMHFLNGNIVLTMKDGTSTYTSIASVQKMYIASEGTNGIDGVTDAVECVWDGATLQINGGLVADVKVYTVNGSLMKQCLLTDGRIDLSDLRNGMYIVCVGGQSFKIVKK